MFYIAFNHFLLDDAVRFSPDLGLLNQVIIKIALSWNGGRNGEKDKLHKLLENVFLSATSLTHRSLAFGVQNFCGWPYKTFCKCLIFSLKQVSSDAIDKVYFCCQDENVCQNIKGILRDAAIKEFHAPSGIIKTIFKCWIRININQILCMKNLKLSKKYFIVLLLNVIRAIGHSYNIFSSNLRKVHSQEPSEVLELKYRSQYC